MGLFVGMRGDFYWLEMISYGKRVKIHAVLGGMALACNMQSFQNETIGLSDPLFSGSQQWIGLDVERGDLFRGESLD